MINKRTKLTLTALFAGISSLSVSSLFALTGCSKAEETVVMTTTEEAENYLSTHVSRLNDTDDIVSQKDELAQDFEFSKFLNTHLTIQNLANSFVQNFAPSLAVVVGTTSQLSITVSGDSFKLVFEKTVVAETTTKTIKTWEFTLTKGYVEAGQIVPAKITAKQNWQTNGVVQNEGAGSAELINASLIHSVGTGEGAPKPGWYNAVIFKTNNDSNLTLCLSGEVDISDPTNWVSTLDTKNVDFEIGLIR